jgi:hypothetical protein
MGGQRRMGLIGPGKVWGCDFVNIVMSIEVP